MVLQVTRYDIHPDKLEAYLKWAEGAIKRMISVSGVLCLPSSKISASRPGEFLLYSRFKERDFVGVL
jgi:hypothetical protein